MRYKAALSPPLSVQLTVTFTVPLPFPERPTQERVGTEGGPEEMSGKQNKTKSTKIDVSIVYVGVIFTVLKYAMEPLVFKTTNLILP